MAALEPVALLANDGLLILDDFRQLPGDACKRAAREAFHFLTSGRDKARATQHSKYHLSHCGRDV